MRNGDGAFWRGLFMVLALAAALAGCGGGEGADVPAGMASLEADAAAKAPSGKPDPAAVGGGEISPDVVPLAAGTPIYRFAKISNGAYFYTGSAEEKEQIARYYPDFRYEGEAFLSSTGAGSVPVYRFANLNNGGYFYTANPAERDLVIASYPHLRYEGSTFAVASPGEPGAAPVYRLANLTNGAYLYTASRAEHDMAVATGIWRPEGEAFHAHTGAPASGGQGQDVYEATPRVAIPDDNANGVTSTLNVTRTGASGTVSVRVQINHTYIGDLLVELVHPDGTVYTLHNRTGGSTDNIDQTYTVNVGSKPSNGTWRLRVSDRAFLDTGTLVSWRLSFPSGSSQPSPGATYENTQRQAIPDNSSTGITSRIDVTRTGASGPVAVHVRITHTYIGDLVVELQHPDGTVYMLHNRSGGSADDIDQVFTVDAGSKPSNGSWTLRVKDVSWLDTGTLDRWSLTFSGSSGGGGGSPDPDPGTGDPVTPRPPQGWTVSGTISIAPTSAVDSDINDPNHPLRSNDDFPVAQPLRTPVLLVGTVNERGYGPQGATRNAGDDIDVFKVSLRAGQVVELEFSADPDENDLDLYLFNAREDVVGESIGVNRHECVRVTRDGDYYVAVYAYTGASIYNLRIGSPNEASGCANSASHLASIIPGQLVAAAADTATPERQRETLQAARVQAAGRVEPGVPQLLQLAGSARERAQAAGHPVAATRSETLQSVLDTVAQAKRLRKTGLYAYVEPNRYMYPLALVGTFPPNDRQYVAQQWHYGMISLPDAMARIASLSPMPSTRPVVAVIDSGVMREHPDLAEQLVDGFSFISVTREGDRNAADGGNDPSTAAHTPSWHGTHVAGTVGAVTFNGEAGAGVAPMARIMPLRVFRPESPGATSYDIVNAILYAAGLSNSSGRLPSRRADVINMSLGGIAACPSSYADAINRARAQGVIVVAAAGNESRNDLGRMVAVGTPANCPGVISVGAVDARARQTFYSNGGGNLSVAAPGGDQSQSTNGSGYPDSVFSTIGAFDNAGRRMASFGPLMGTSMASPHVAGVMALMRFVNPSITPAQVDTLLANGQLTDDIGSPGRDNATGIGLINARKAVDAALALRGGGGGGGAPAPSGTVVASPASLDFGSLQTTADLELRITAATTETVTSITASSSAVTVTSRQVDPKTGLGLYAVSVDRSRLSAGTHFLSLTVRTSARQFQVPLSVHKPGGATTDTQANFGPVYVLLIDPDTGETLDAVRVSASQGTYRWEITGFREADRVQVLAGTDLDNDDYICQRGEPCGGFPVLSADQAVVDLTRQRTRLDFSIAPFGGINASSLSASGRPQDEGVRKPSLRR